MDKSIYKKTGQELQNYIMTMSRHNVVKSKKGKGSYTRKEKYKVSY